METRKIEGFTVDACKSEYHVDFTIYYDLCQVHPYDDDGIYFFGYIKWDGCSNWHVPGDDYQLHFCGLEEIRRLTRLMETIYAWAIELMPESLLAEDPH